MKKIFTLIIMAVLIIGTSEAKPAKVVKKNTFAKKEIVKDMGTVNEEVRNPEKDSVVVDVKTTLGDFKVLLYDDTPIHKSNFLKLVREGFYDGVLFHRVIKDFMVQTGDPDSKTAQPGQMLGTGDPGYTLEAEILYPTHYHKYGALAAARTGDAVNPEKRSSGSQFYVVTGNKYGTSQVEQMLARKSMAPRQAYFRKLVSSHRDEIEKLQAANDQEGLKALEQQLITETESNVPLAEPNPQMIQDYTTIGGTPHLDADYTVFGEVISGMDTIEKIQHAETSSGDRPKEDIRIISMKVEE
ncbi:MAG: peptidylprolyl isomerase [Prevotella sp.]|nr:peptidylprolyl isomerase [Bacteroides sp.]MCM1365956.1 peptidylprolyl isomerase [Prevotella sp.]MCM1436623.1 peptidylprolyl isomerase [Prevotella sp.]